VLRMESGARQSAAPEPCSVASAYAAIAFVALTGVNAEDECPSRPIERVLLLAALSLLRSFALRRVFEALRTE